MIAILATLLGELGEGQLKGLAQLALVTAGPLVLTAVDETGGKGTPPVIGARRSSVRRTARTRRAGLSVMSAGNSEMITKGGTFVCPEPVERGRAGIETQSIH